MSERKGRIMGVGNAQTRINEITADDLAVDRNFKVGWNYGVVNRSNYNFNLLGYALNKITIGQGVMFAYGYFGYADEFSFEFIRPSIPQYHIIYAELDRSQIPNTCKIKAKNNQSSIKIENAFRQDILSKVKTGIFQLPLWRVKIDSSGIKEVVDLRALRNEIRDTFYAPKCNNVFGTISSSVQVNSYKRVVGNIGSITREAIDTAYMEFTTTYTLTINQELVYDGERAEVSYIEDANLYELKVKRNGKWYNKQNTSITATINDDLPPTDRSLKIATTNFVHLATRNYINNE